MYFVFQVLCQKESLSFCLEVEAWVECVEVLFNSEEVEAHKEEDFGIFRCIKRTFFCKIFGDIVKCLAKKLSSFRGHTWEAHYKQILVRIHINVKQVTDLLSCMCYEVTKNRATTVLPIHIVGPYAKSRLFQSW